MRKTLAETTPASAPASTATSSTLTAPATSSGNYQASPSPSPDVTISPPSTPPTQDSAATPSPSPQKYSEYLEKFLRYFEQRAATSYLCNALSEYHGLLTRIGAKHFPPHAAKLTKAIHHKMKRPYGKEYFPGITLTEALFTQYGISYNEPGRGRGKSSVLSGSVPLFPTTLHEVTNIMTKRTTPTKVTNNPKDSSAKDFGTTTATLREYPLPYGTNLLPVPTSAALASPTNYYAHITHPTIPFLRYLITADFLEFYYTAVAPDSGAFPVEAEYYLPSSCIPAIRLKPVGIPASCSRTLVCYPVPVGGGVIFYRWYGSDLPTELLAKSKPAKSPLYGLRSLVREWQKYAAQKARELHAEWKATPVAAPAITTTKESE